jgi:putative ABC transport system substrate-binding protein
MFNVADPVARGLVASLTRPGGNVTGLTNLVEGQTLKSLEMLKEGAPRISRVAILMDPSNQAQVALSAEQDIAAQTLSLKLQRLNVRGQSDLDATFAALLRERAQALYLFPLRIGQAGAKRIMEFAIKHRLPTLGGVSVLYPQAGVLFFYSHSLAEQFQRLAAYVDKILKGAKPADLPVEQPTKFGFVINLKTAKLLGLTIPQSLLVRADEIIR